MKRVIFISGLGANEMAFSNIGELSYKKVMVKWIPVTQEDTLLSYTERLISIYSISNNDILVGLSFGGLISQKISALLGNKLLILVSSFRSKEDLKLLFRLPLTLGIHKLMPTFKIPIIDSIVARVLNGGNKDSIPVLNKMLQSTDYKLMKWSLDSIDKAESVDLSETVVYLLIGDKDLIVKTWKADNRTILKGGSHFAVYDQGVYMTELIKDIIRRDN
ncbi:hypothetical protein N9L92_02860 [Saprospiraceae bacterium]|nr:hypothetical protein [Saprospiraceae bacterium]